MPPKKAVRVFISYARKDTADLAVHLRGRLAKAALEPWLDTSRIAGGGIWNKEIEQAIDTCDVALSPPAHLIRSAFTVLHKRYSNSEWTKKTKYWS
jgi:hypothetical protein